MSGEASFTSKICPFCAETIKVEAKFCLFCKRDLPVAAPSPPETQKPNEKKKSLTLLKAWYIFIAACIVLVLPSVFEYHIACLAGVPAVVLMCASFVGLFVPKLRLHAVVGGLLSMCMVLFVGGNMGRLEPADVKEKRMLAEKEERKSAELRKKEEAKQRAADEKKAAAQKLKDEATDKKLAAQNAKKEKALRKGKELKFGEFYGQYNNFDLYGVKTERDDYCKYIVGTALNTSRRNYRYVQVQAQITGKNGSVLESPFANVNNIAAGATWHFKILVREDGGGWSYRITDIDGR